MKKGILGKVLIAALTVGVLASIVYSVVINHTNKPKYDKDKIQISVSTTSDGYDAEDTTESSESYSDPIEFEDEELEVVGFNPSDAVKSTEGYEDVSESEANSGGLTIEEMNEILSFNMDSLVSNNKISLANASEYVYGDENFDGATSILGKTDALYYNAEDDEYMCFFFVNAEGCAVRSQNGVIFIKMSDGVIDEIRRVVISVTWANN